MLPGIRLPFLFAAGAAAMMLAGPAAAQSSVAAPAESAQELVRRVIAHELAEEAKPVPYICRLRREDPKGSWTRDILETRDGLVARLIASNGRPATPEERARDDQHLQRLLEHPDEQRKRRERQQRDEEKVRAMIRAMPDAFFYDYDGSEPGPRGDLVRLKFRRNPKFDPPTRETLVFKGMEGMALVEPRDLRVVRIEATLVEDVTLGWGLLARLHKGGHFTLEQSLVPGGNWETTKMTLDFTGKAFLFKTIRIQQTQTVSDFRPAPTGLSLAEGIALLKKQNGAVAEKE